MEEVHAHGWRTFVIPINVALQTAFLVPGAVFGIFFILDVILFAEGSSGAVPFRFMVAIIALWFCISTPLVFFGSYFGFKKPVTLLQRRRPTD